MGTRSKQAQPSEAPPDQAEDTALRSLDALERAKLSMDAWEPSLLRKLLKAQNKLRRKSR
jgi:hypothetical protein